MSVASSCSSERSTYLVEHIPVVLEDCVSSVLACFFEGRFFFLSCEPRLLDEWPLLSMSEERREHRLCELLLSILFEVGVRSGEGLLGQYFLVSLVRERLNPRRAGLSALDTHPTSKWVSKEIARFTVLSVEVPKEGRLRNGGRLSGASRTGVDADRANMDLLSSANFWLPA
jgi:hypothetical protein